MSQAPLSLYRNTKINFMDHKHWKHYLQTLRVTERLLADVPEAVRNNRRTGSGFSGPVTETVTVTEKQEKEKEVLCLNVGETPED